MENDINSYVWRDARISKDRSEKQVETRLVDLDEDQLQMIYNHCKEMLYNSEYKHLGRMHIVNQIETQLDCINSELAYRWFMEQKDSKGEPLFTPESLLLEIRYWKLSIENYNPNERYELRDFVEVPKQFKHVSIDLLQAACRDSLGSFDHSKITLNFLYKLGIYITNEEMKEINEDIKITGLDPNKISLQTKIANHIKTPLNLINADIKVNAKGLSAKEFTAMIYLKRFKGHKSCKYSALSQIQLETLNNKVLYALEDIVRKQIVNWQNIMSQIEEVAKYKHFKLQ